MTQNQPSANDLAQRLAAAFAPETDGAGEISDLKRLSGGASQETWSFDLKQGDHLEPLILRRSPGGMPRTEGHSAAPLETEAALITLAEAAGVAVPSVKLVLQERHGLGPGFIMSRLEGETIPRKILRDAEFAGALPVLAGQCGEALAGIHGLDAQGVADLPHLSLQDQIEQYQAIYDDFGDPHPVFEIAFQWLEQNASLSDNNKLVHGDFRHGNLMIGPEGLRAVLDWELAHTGDPMEDLAWICVNSWRFGHPEKPVGGFGERQELFDAYEAAGGSVDPNRVHLWEVFGTLKWGIICILMVSAFRLGPDRSIERATIGRRSSEAEIDLLNLLLE